jgi:hypothetical protein
MTKKLAWTPFAFRMSRIFGVQSGSGPSSKVSASFPGVVPVRSMTKGVGTVL